MSNIGCSKKMSIITFHDASTIRQQFLSPIDINTLLKYTGGVTDFKPVFQDALKLTKKYGSKQCKTVFVFMSDGVANNPQKQINQFQQWKYQNEDLFEFNGIQFGGLSRLMKQIANDLDGSSSVAFSGKDLAYAYIEIINRNQKQRG